LSHCWGTLRILTLTTENYDAFLVRIPIEELTKTFQDAINVTKYLNFKYLWIDSLCIIQDDRSDWDRESALMTSVYGCSTLNLGASSAKDGRTGFFHNRKSTWRCQIVMKSDGKQNLYDCYPDRSMVPQHVPLHDRAWVVQERFMPARMLHFYHEQVFWDCNEQPACETLPKGKKFPEGYLSASSTFIIDRENGFEADSWLSIVQGYSRSRLTRSSDKLVAIGGLAQVVQNQTNDDYLAGLWRSRLQTDLLWFVTNSTGRRLRPYRAPTWSWASIEGAISFAGRKRNLDNLKATPNPYTRVVDVQIDYVTSNSFGEVANAFLLLECSFFCPVTLIQPQEPSKSKKIVIGESTFFAQIYIDSSDAYENTQTYFLPMHQYPPHDGLLLQRADHSSNKYQRVGLCYHWCFSDEDSEAYISAYEAAANQARNSDFSEVKKDSDGTVHRMIEIV